MSGTRTARFRNVKHSARPVGEVVGLNMKRLQSAIRWSGKVKLFLTGEVLDAYLAECTYPKRDGTTYYACASTGLLFDKESGRCRQSSSVLLLIDSVAPVDCSYKAFCTWQKARQASEEQKAFTISRRGPKPKDYAPTDDPDDETEDDYAAID